MSSIFKNKITKENAHSVIKVLKSFWNNSEKLNTNLGNITLDNFREVIDHSKI